MTLLVAMLLQTDWRTDADAAAKEAKESGKLLMLRFIMPT
jgi:hypothetical protein